MGSFSYYTKLNSEEGRKSRKYLKLRGLSDEIIAKFGIGFAESSKDKLYRFLKNKGFSDSVLLESGLFFYNENGGIRD